MFNLTPEQCQEMLRAAHKAVARLPVPTCHFQPMTLHSSCSDRSGSSDGYACDFCGHTESIDEAWAKVEAREAARSKTS